MSKLWPGLLGASPSEVMVSTVGSLLARDETKTFGPGGPLQPKELGLRGGGLSDLFFQFAQSKPGFAHESMAARLRQNLIQLRPA